MPSPRLSPGALRTGLTRLPAWKRRGLALHRTFEFADFPAAMRFVNRVARLAERAGHHPDIDIRWNQVHLVLTTHDVGGLTRLDLDLAARLDRLAPPIDRSPE